MLRTANMAYAAAVALEEKLLHADELVKAIRVDAQEMTNAEMMRPLFEQHPRDALSVLETFQTERGKNAARVNVPGFLFFTLALSVNAVRREVPALTWRLMFAPAVGGRCAITGGTFLADAMKRLLSNQEIFDRSREIRVMSDRGLVELEFDGAKESDPPVVSAFQAIGKGFVPQTRAIKHWRSIATHRLKPFFDLINSED
jgi:hypothetical protein